MCRVPLVGSKCFKTLEFAVNIEPLVPFSSVQFKQGTGTRQEAADLQAMGRGTTKKPRTTKKEKDSKKTKNFGIPKYAYLGKSALAAYPDEQGNALWLGMKDSVAEVLSPENLVEKATNKNTEMLAAWRPQRHTTVPRWSSKEPRRRLWIAWQPSSRNPKARLSCRQPRISTSARKAPLPVTVRKAVRGYVKYLEAAGSELQAALVDVAASSAKVYLFAMHCLEQKALLGKPSAFAKKWRRSGSQPKELKQWLKEPSNSQEGREGGEFRQCRGLRVRLQEQAVHGKLQ